MLEDCLDRHLLLVCHALRRLDDVERELNRPGVRRPVVKLGFAEENEGIERGGGGWIMAGKTGVSDDSERTVGYAGGRVQVEWTVVRPSGEHEARDDEQDRNDVDHAGPHGLLMCELRRVKRGAGVERAGRWEEGVDDGLGANPSEAVSSRFHQGE